MSKHSIVFFLLLIYFIIDSVIKSCPRFPRLHFQQWTCLRCSNKNHFRFGETVILNLTKKELVKGARNNKYISLFTSNRKNKPPCAVAYFPEFTPANPWFWSIISPSPEAYRYLFREPPAEVSLFRKHYNDYFEDLSWSLKNNHTKISLLMKVSMKTILLDNRLLMAMNITTPYYLRAS